MARLRGRAPRGERLRAGIPHGHLKTTTFVAGLELSPGDIVIMDNLGSHKGPVVRRAIEAAGATLKALLRKAAERTIDALWTTIGHVLDAFTATECANYFRATGYEPD